MGLYRDFVRWVRGRVVVPDGATVLPHQPGRLQMVGFLTAVMLIEIVVVHFLLPAGVVRVVALVLSVWGLVFVWSMIAGERVRPGYVDDCELVLRRGKKVFAVVPLTDVSDVRSDRTFEAEVVVGGGELVVGGPVGTDVVLELWSPVAASRDRYPWKKPVWEDVDRVRFYSGGDAGVLERLGAAQLDVH
ncbi:hypothetical protein [Corynebacterium glaucum]|uniref:hypothetical protein n=1 Tax=Corynebacterium glaucum TaxID=187491 RepID=UPI002659DCD1|nr:hypothetical protein [Corynebacterium glaucum]